MKLPYLPSNWPKHWHELWLERAAIMEADAGLDRWMAERAAENDIRALAEREAA